MLAREFSTLETRTVGEVGGTQCFREYTSSTPVLSHESPSVQDVPTRCALTYFARYKGRCYSKKLARVREKLAPRYRDLHILCQRRGTCSDLITNHTAGLQDSTMTSSEFPSRQRYQDLGQAQGLLLHSADHTVRHANRGCAYTQKRRPLGCA